MTGTCKRSFFFLLLYSKPFLLVFCPNGVTQKRFHCFKDSSLANLNTCRNGGAMLPSSGMASVTEAKSLLIVPLHCNRFQMVLDTMETLNTRGKRSALVRGRSSGQRTGLKYCFFCFVCFFS